MMHKQLKLSRFHPSQLMQIAESFAHLPGTCLLLSGGNGDSAKRSFLSLFPYETIEIFGSEICHRKGETIDSIRSEDPWEDLRSRFFSTSDGNSFEIAFGWFGYGMGASADKGKRLPYRSSNIADAFWQRCALVIVVDHEIEEAEVRILMTEAVRASVGDAALVWLKRFSTVDGWNHYLKELRGGSCINKKPIKRKRGIFNSDVQRRAKYLNAVQQVQQLIREGEIYQINLSHEFLFDAIDTPFSLFQEINELNPAPFSTFFNSGAVTLVCSSPERFLSKQGVCLEARPIKGTIPRGRNRKEDEKNQKKLLTSAKERAELLMITDLMRNDLGKVSETGSVVVSDLYRCEVYTNVFHLLSVVQSKADRRLSSIEIIRSTFPGGSITGCPKLRAIEVIDALEQRARGLYAGSIGYIAANGDFDLNIAIRTIVTQGGISSLQLGSGILFDSNAEEEYRETLHKGASLFELLGLREELQKEIDGSF